MVVDPMVEGRRFDFLPLARLGVTRIEEAFAIVGPARRGELAPADPVRQLPARRQLPHPELGPVRAPFGPAVSQVVPCGGDGVSGERHRAVRREGVRIQQNHGRCRQRGLGVDHRLLLESRVTAEDQPSRLAEWHPRLRIVPDLRKPLPDGLPGRNLLQVPEGQLVLGTVQILQPAIGVGDSRAEILLHRVRLPTLRILHPRLPHHPLDHPRQ